MPSGRFINLRAKPFKEFDLILEVLGNSGERLTLTAKNAIKSKKRFGGGVLEPLHFSEIQYTQSKSGYLYVQEAKSIYAFEGLRDNYQKLEVGFYLLQLIAKATKEGMLDNKPLFDLLGNGLKALEKSEAALILKLQFELKYLFYLGFLAPDDDFAEFMALPIHKHREIKLTDEEFCFLAKRTKGLLREVDLNLKEEI